MLIRYCWSNRGLENWRSRTGLRLRWSYWGTAKVDAKGHSAWWPVLRGGNTSAGLNELCIGLMPTLGLSPLVMQIIADRQGVHRLVRRSSISFHSDFLDSISLEFIAIRRILVSDAPSQDTPASAIPYAGLPYMCLTRDYVFGSVNFGKFAQTARLTVFCKWGGETFCASCLYESWSYLLLVPPC